MAMFAVESFDCNVVNLQVVDLVVDDNDCYQFGSKADVVYNLVLLL